MINKNLELRTFKRLLCYLNHNVIFKKYTVIYISETTYIIKTKKFLFKLYHYENESMVQIYSFKNSLSYKEEKQIKRLFDSQFQNYKVEFIMECYLDVHKHINCMENFLCCLINGDIKITKIQDFDI